MLGERESSIDDWPWVPAGIFPDFAVGVIVLTEELVLDWLSGRSMLGLDSFPLSPRWCGSVRSSRSPGWRLPRSVPNREMCSLNFPSSFTTSCSLAFCSPLQRLDRKLRVEAFLTSRLRSSVSCRSGWDGRTVRVSLFREGSRDGSGRVFVLCRFFLKGDLLHG